MLEALLKPTLKEKKKEKRFFLVDTSVNNQKEEEEQFCWKHPWNRRTKKEVFGDIRLIFQNRNGGEGLLRDAGMITQRGGNDQARRQELITQRGGNDQRSTWAMTTNHEVCTKCCGC